MFDDLSPLGQGANHETSHAIRNSQHDTRGFLAGFDTPGAIGFATTVSADMPGLSTVQPAGAGSIIEQLKIIEPLTNLTAHGSITADTFEVVIPSLTGYGFSANAIGRCCGPRRGGIRVFRQLRAH